MSRYATYSPSTCNCCRIHRYWGRAFIQRMHDSMMAQIGMDHEHHHHDNGFGGSDGWVDISSSYNSSQHQSPIYEQGGFGFMQQPVQHNGLPTEPLYSEDISTSTTTYGSPAVTTPHHAKSPDMAEYVDQPSKLLSTTGCNSSSFGSCSQRQWYKIACYSRYSISTENAY